jgi:hypothetical protein
MDTVDLSNEQNEELVEYMLESVALKERIRYLEDVEHTARQFVRRNGSKNRLVEALDKFERLERSKWAEAQS